MVSRSVVLQMPQAGDWMFQWELSDLRDLESVEGIPVVDLLAYNIACPRAFSSTSLSSGATFFLLGGGVQSGKG